MPAADHQAGGHIGPRDRSHPHLAADRVRVRRNIYRKLDINSQAELFSLFINCIPFALPEVAGDPLESCQSAPGGARLVSLLEVARPRGGHGRIGAARHAAVMPIDGCSGVACQALPGGGSGRRGLSRNVDAALVRAQPLRDVDVPLQRKNRPSHPGEGQHRVVDGAQRAAVADLRSPIPLVADESCTDRGSLAQLAGRYQYVTTKLDKCGGLTEALAMADAAEQRGFGLMVGNMCGTSLAMVPAFLLAQRCSSVDLDGPLLQQLDRATPLHFDGGLVGPPSPALWG